MVRDKSLQTATSSIKVTKKEIAANEISQILVVKLSLISAISFKYKGRGIQVTIN